MAPLILTIAAIPLLLWITRQFFLPRPIPGIPYVSTSANRIMGDVPAMQQHMAGADGGTFITYILKTMHSLNSPLIQMFIRPLGRPLVILADFPESHDLLVKRKEFDRSHTLGDLVKGLAPDHHIHLPTGPAWRTQRRLVQDLMTPTFLHNVAGPAVYLAVDAMVDLWRAKSRVAAGRPWTATDDVTRMALDAIMAFAFGQEFGHSAIGHSLVAVEGLGNNEINALQHGNVNNPVEFPRAKLGTELQATVNLTETVGEVMGNPWPSLTWAWIMRRPKIKRAVKIREGYIKEAVTQSVTRLEESPETSVRSAVDQMVEREAQLAAKDGRSPRYFSRVMFDEVRSLALALKLSINTCCNRSLALSSPATKPLAPPFAGASST
jgi:hypothetical protein